MLPDLFAYFNDTYDTDGGGYTTLSLEYAVVWLRGVAAGFGANALWAGALVMPWRTGLRVVLASPPCLRRCPCITVDPAGCLRCRDQGRVLTAIFYLGSGRQLYRRRHRLAGTLVGEMLGDRIGAGWRRHLRQAPVAVVVCLLTLSSVGLNRYYRIPNQPTRVSAEWLVGQQGDEGYGRRDQSCEMGPPLLRTARRSS